MELRFTKKKHVRLPKTITLLFIVEKLWTIKVFKQIHSYETFTFYGKTMVLWTKTIYMVLYRKNMELRFTMGKNYGTIENHS